MRTLKFASLESNRASIARKYPRFGSHVELASFLSLSFVRRCVRTTSLVELRCKM